MDHALHLAAIGRILAQGFGIVGAVDTGDLAVRILLDPLGLDDVGVAQAHFLAQHQPLELLVRFFLEVRLVDEDLAGEVQLAGTHLGIARVRRCGQHLIGGQVLDDHFHRMKHRHGTGGVLVEIVTDAGFQHAHLDDVVLLGHADALAELADGGRGVTTATQTGDGQHARIVPTADVPLGHQQVQLALGHDGVFEVQTRELVLTRVTVDADVVQHPVIEATVVLELQGAQGVGDPLQGVRDAVGEVIHRVDAPLVTGLVVVSKLDAIDDGIAHHHEGGCHVDLGAQAGAAFGHLAALHLGKQRQVLFHAAIAERAVLARGGQGAAVFAHLLGGKLVHIGQTLLDELDGIAVQLVEIVGGVADLAAPLEAEPLYVLLDGLHELDVFLRRVGVIEAQVALALIVTGDAEVQADGLGVADMEITVRLRRKTGMHALVLTAGQIFIDDLTDKVGWAARLAHGSPQKCVTGGSCAGWHPHHPAVKPDMIPHYAPCLNLNLANPGHWRAKNGKQREPL